MSLNRENVIWKSRNGTWSIGFFHCYSVGDTSDPDYDPEWDVEYDYDTFDWASTGHPTEDAAYKAWDGANPGGYTVLATPGDETDRYDKMAAAWIEHDRAERRKYNRTVLLPSPLRYR